jgi:hypothetical protein
MRRLGRDDCIFWMEVTVLIVYVIPINALDEMR